MKKKRRVVRMNSTATKPIRSTQVVFESSADKKAFENYATSKKKTDSVGMNKMREMVRNHKDNRK